jgi:hypothetical protein
METERGDGELLEYRWPKDGTGKDYEIRRYRTPQGWAVRVFVDDKELGNPYGEQPYVLFLPQTKMEHLEEINSRHIVRLAMLAIEEHWFAARQEGDKSLPIEIRYQYKA